MKVYLLVGTFACCGSPHLFDFSLDSSPVAIQEKIASAAVSLGEPVGQIMALEMAPELYQMLSYAVTEALLPGIHEYVEGVMENEPGATRQ